MIAAGVNTKALSTYMGHSSITITLDRYGHLLPGNEAEAATLFDAWLRHAAKRVSRRGRACIRRPLRRDADDCSQEVFTRMWRKAPLYDRRRGSAAA
jgi:hypothetical protein